MSRLALGLLAGLTVTMATGVATLAIAKDRGWALPGMRAPEREPGPVTVVLHRGGGTVVADAEDDPRRYRSGILARQGMTSVEIPPFRGTDAQWDRFVGCVRDRFDGYGVDIVDEPPTEGSYSMAFVGGTPDLLRYAETVGGIAPHANRVLESSVVFVFQPNGVPARALCETAAHEIGHILGLDHSRDCTDIMSYESCGNKEFRTEHAPCGEWEDRACEDGGHTQSAHEHLAAVVGVRPRTPAPPAPERARVAARPTIDVRRSARAEAGQPFSVIVDLNGADPDQVDLFWYSRRGHRLRCGDTHEAVPFTCERSGSVYTFTLTPGRHGPRKFNVRVKNGARYTKTPTFQVNIRRPR